MNDLLKQYISPQKIETPDPFITPLSNNDMNNSPLLNFQKSDQLNITPENTNALLQYTKAQLSGETTVLNNTGKTSTTPFGTRYFLNTNVTCNKLDNSGTTNRFILVDNMKYKKYNDGTFYTNQYGLLNSVEGSLQEMEQNSIVTNGKIINYDINSQKNKCLPVTIYTDGSNSATDTQYITVNDCNKIDTSAFPNQIKPCPNIEGLELMATELENQDNKENIYISKDPITQFYVGSITIIGLYIFYKLMQKK